MMIEYFKSDLKNTEPLKKLWLACFDESRQAVDLFFERNADNMTAYCASEGEELAAALYLIKCSLNEKKAHYLCGAGTYPEYRNKKIMTRLIIFALNDAANNGDVCSVLMPAEKGLYGFYEKLGYKPNYSVDCKCFSRDELKKYAFSFSDGNYDYEQLQKRCYGSDFLLWNNSFVDFAKEYYKIYGAKVIDNENCLAFYEENDGCAEVFYSVYTDFLQLAKYLIENSQAEQFHIFCKGKEKFGMFRLLDNKFKMPDNIFIGITLG
jgi:GNAT superfamily N-acetyltransferase